jgi:copper(I)-binding protein
MRRMLSITLASIATLVLAACAGAPGRPAMEQPAAAPAATLGALTINDPWVRPVNPNAPPPTAMPNATPMAMGEGAAPAPVNTGGYLTIVNSGAEADALIAASAAGELSEAVELHTVIEEGGMMKMRPVEKIEVPANGEAVLKPGSFHVMFVGMKQELKPGDTVKLTLTFEKAGSVEVEAVVRPANPMP